MNTTHAVRAILVAVVLSVQLLGHSRPANANVLRWDLQNVTFQDGGTATGFFLYDADAPERQQLVGYDVTLGVGNAAWPFPALRWTTASGGALDEQNGSLIFVGPTGLFDPVLGRGSMYLNLFFARDSLSDAGGAVTFTDLRVYDTYSGPSRGGLTGYVVAIPEPSGTLLLALGLAAIMVVRRGTVEESAK
jgi:hypothetical protein